MSDYRLISSDSHVTMPDAAWQEYLDPEFRDRAPRVERTDEGDFRVFEGKRTPIMTLDNLAGKKPEEFTLNVRKLDEQRAGAWDPAERIKDMDLDGVDAEVLYVGGPLQTADAELKLNSVRGYNRWLSDYASHAPDRLLGMAAIPIDTPERAVEELAFAAAQPGLVSGYIPLFPPEGDYGDPKWNVMWEAFLEAGMHHLECQFDFDAAREQLAKHGIETMAPFTDFPHLRQAFTKGETWQIEPARIERLLSAGRITTEQANRFRREGALGSHMEILERNDGYKGFNQTGISEIITRTDPRRQEAP